jgi:hypothetical protein
MAHPLTFVQFHSFLLISHLPIQFQWLDPCLTCSICASRSFQTDHQTSVPTEVSAELRQFMIDGFRKRLESQRDDQVRPAAAEVEAPAGEPPVNADRNENPWGLRPGDPEPDPDENLDLEEVPELIP